MNDEVPKFHPAALVESTEIGEGTRIWAFAHILAGAVVGKNCNICDGVFIEGGALVGNNVTVKNGVFIWNGITIEDDVFVGPGAVFTNDKLPRSPRMPHAKLRYRDENGWLERTLVKQGCSIGANATIVPGIVLGEYSFVAAGSVVTKNVAAHTMVAGVPAKPVGFVCYCGRPTASGDVPICEDCEKLKVD